MTWELLDKLVYDWEDRRRCYGFIPKFVSYIEAIISQTQWLIEQEYGEDIAFLYQRAARKNGIVLVPLEIVGVNHGQAKGKVW